MWEQLKVNHISYRHQFNHYIVSEVELKEQEFEGDEVVWRSAHSFIRIHSLCWRLKPESTDKRATVFHFFENYGVTLKASWLLCGEQSCISQDLPTVTNDFLFHLQHTANEWMLVCGRVEGTGSWPPLTVEPRSQRLLIRPAVDIILLVDAFILSQHFFESWKL